MPAENDREQNLQRLADENGYWAEEHLRLITVIRRHKRQLEKLPEIIQQLEKALVHATDETLRTGREHDALAAEGEDAEFRTWADDQADEYTDWQETTRLPMSIQ